MKLLKILAFPFAVMLFYLWLVVNEMLWLLFGLAIVPIVAILSGFKRGHPIDNAACTILDKWEAVFAIRTGPRKVVRREFPSERYWK